MRLAIAGDLHGDWTFDDEQLLDQLKPDAVLFVGDLSDGDLRLVKAITRLNRPCAVILGNHDRGRDRSGEKLRQQLLMLGELDCSWRMRNWSSPPVAIIGCRPCSSGGGFHLSEAVRSVFGPVTEEESANRIVQAASGAPETWPLVLLAHSGPTGLGSDASSICGRDWKHPHIDWGDRDLAIAVEAMRRHRAADLVVFGHMHHCLRGGKGERLTFHRDRYGTAYVNAACVPRSGSDESGQTLIHFTWVEFEGRHLSLVSHRWFHLDGTLAYEQTLLRQPRESFSAC
ncbi:MAG: TIGR04168 family protein [Cyanobium sp. MED195]|uniref:TIGR04168 family protein n=1 Tax=Synechococcus sp. Cu2B8-bc1011 TaxID=3093725 RepID=UPI000C4F692B|nr:TIGR04168 family protein [Cyanobium sp. MED195]